MIHALTDMNRHGVARLGCPPDVLGQPPHQMSRRARDFLHRFFIVIRQMPLVHFHNWHHFDFAPLGKLHTKCPCQGCLDFQMGAHFVPADKCDLLRTLIPNTKSPIFARCGSVSPCIL